MVDEQKLANRLAFVRGKAAGQIEGIFGPASMSWRVDREAAIFLGAGRALLLQLAHPWVAAAIADHSTTLTDPIGRFHRTFGFMFTFVFGTLDHALEAAQRLHRRHAAIAGVMPTPAGRFAAGSTYFANDPAALLWVHATLIDTALMAHGLVLPPLSQTERETYYAECKIFAALFGIPQDALPADWPAFQVYMEEMLASDVLTVTPAARAMAHQLIVAGAKPWLRVPRWYRCVTAKFLPVRLRVEFGLTYEPQDARRAEAALSRSRKIYQWLPGRLRTVGPYQEACGRVIGEAHPDIGVRMLNRLWIGRSRL